MVPTEQSPDADSALSAAAAELDEVEAALVRLDDGTFDRCEVCGGAVGSERLLANPLLTRCPAHTHADTHAPAPLTPGANPGAGG